MLGGYFSICAYWKEVDSLVDMILLILPFGIFAYIIKKKAEQIIKLREEE